jgi:hypothetical protein
MHFKSILARYPGPLAAGEVLAAGNVVYQAADGLIYKADANGVGTYPAIGVIDRAYAIGDNVEIVSRGLLAGLSGKTVGAAQYLSETAGAMTESAPTVVQAVGTAISATEVFIDLETVQSSLTAGAVATAHLANLAVTGAKTAVKNKMHFAKTPVMNLDIGAGTTADFVITRPSTAITITAARFVYTEATAAAGATAATIKVGTAEGGEQVVAAANIEQPKAVGAATALTIVSGAVGANTPVFVRLTGVVATPIAGEGFVEIEYTVDD